MKLVPLQFNRSSSQETRRNCYKDERMCNFTDLWHCLRNWTSSHPASEWTCLKAGLWRNSNGKKYTSTVNCKIYLFSANRRKCDKFCFKRYAVRMPTVVLPNYEIQAQALSTWNLFHKLSPGQIYTSVSRSGFPWALSN